MIERMKRSPGLISIMMTAVPLLVLSPVFQFSSAVRIM